MRLAHYFRRETRQHMVRRVCCCDQQSNSRRVATPLLDTTFGCPYSKVGGGARRLLGFATEKVRIVFKRRKSLVDAEAADCIDELWRQLVHHATNQLSCFKEMLRGGCCR